MEQERLTNLAAQVKRGDMSDHDCARATHRIRVARVILGSQKIRPEWNHSDSTIVEWGREKHSCDYRCEAVWPEWVTNRVFNLAVALADEIQTERGSWHQRQINEQRRAS
jgi:hypothetical protein